MIEPLYRAFTADVEFRAAAGKRLLEGQVVPFNIPTDIDPTLREEFLPGAFRHQTGAPTRVQLRNGHSNDQASLQLGHAIELDEQPAGLWGSFRVVDSPMGDHFLALVREGSLREWSVGFFAERSRTVNGVTQYSKATAFECALVSAGAYGELAAVAAVRRAPRPLATPRLDRWKSRFAG